jgi:iron complex outermembrane receptor protein
MLKITQFMFATFGCVCVVVLCGKANAEVFNIASGALENALSAYMAQTGVQLIVSDDALRGVHSKGVKGDLSRGDALSRILSGTGFISQRHSGGTIALIRESQSSDVSTPMLAAASTPTVGGAALETVTVTSSKVGGDIQNIPISITALSQEQLTATQTAGGPDLIKQVPNMTFTKTNFSGYSIQLRGIGTQAISVTTDPAVAVAFNDIPFIRNHFFEQEFYDVSQVEVLRGPQGTLYGRNATAGVVNLISAKPTDQFEAMASADIGNYNQRRLEGMLNVPLLDDRLDLRVAGEWTKRQGYSFNDLTDSRIDGRDLWSSRVSLGWKPYSNLQTTLIWEHFSEDDDRIRSSKQLCKTAPIPTTVDGVPVPAAGGSNDSLTDLGGYFSQGCLPASLYSSESFQVPNGFALPYIAGGIYGGELNAGIDPYASTVQSRNLRVIESSLNPGYKVKNDIVEANTDYAVTPVLTVTSQTGFNQDFLYSTQDYNRFNTTPGIFNSGWNANLRGDINTENLISTDGVFCDPQLGCSNRLVAQDLSTEHAWQLSQEFRLASNFSGPFNFSFGGNYLHYETEENYYVFVNALTAFTYGTDENGGIGPWVPGVSDGHQCLGGLSFGSTERGGYQYPSHPQLGGGVPGDGNCTYLDPNPLGSVNNEGHNYFLSQNPYVLNSYAGFGEVYYQVLSDLKLTTGVRWTDDQKHFVDIPSELVSIGYGYPATAIVDQQWEKFTGRAVANWTPKLDFTDQTLIYASYSHGYKAGGANPPGAILLVFGGNGVGEPDHPLTFKPEFIDAFELGTKNTLLDGALTFNADVFYYNYENYQISEIVDRTSINLNFDAHVKGAEVEGTWEPIPGLRFNFAGGWEDTALAKGDSAIDLIDRTAGNSDWMVLKPFIGQASNCILPKYVVAASILDGTLYNEQESPGSIIQACYAAYTQHLDPVTDLPYVANPTQQSQAGTGGCPTAQDPGCLTPLSGYAGFDPSTAQNDGEGFSKNLSGNELPNAPPFTASFGAQYSIPLTTDWAGTVRGDYYWQDYSWARVFNDNPYDRLRGYTNVNLTLIFTNQDGWQVMLYDKNVFNTTAITGDFLNSDDSGLTTNVFLTDPKLIGIRVTKNW